jgi:hypothetical protein
MVMISWYFFLPDGPKLGNNDSNNPAISGGTPGIVKVWMFFFTFFFGAFFTGFFFFSTIISTPYVNFTAVYSIYIVPGMNMRTSSFQRSLSKELNIVFT